MKIVDEELTELLGGTPRSSPSRSKPPTVILMGGLQGSGKTTTAGKLARTPQEAGQEARRWSACDVYRPAAIEQLRTLGAQLDVPFFDGGTGADPVEIAALGRREARAARAATSSSSTPPAGCTSTQELMQELDADPRRASSRTRCSWSLDAMTGQDAVNVAEQFDDRGRRRRRSS